MIQQATGLRPSYARACFPLLFPLNSDHVFVIRLT